MLRAPGTDRPDRPRSLFFAVIALLAGHLLLGLAHVAMLPPWEGFDETAHYSYLQELADTGRLPRLGDARMSQDVDRYARVGPLPYRSTAPMEENGGFTYRTFFDRSAEHLADARALVHARPVAPRGYAAGDAQNWQAQHPPLYYLTLSPLYRATRHLSWASQLLWLRLASYCIAWVAILVTVWSCAAHAPGGSGSAAHQWGVLGCALWPVVMPAWYPEMARLGNDSLSALIVAGVWFLLLRTGGGIPSIGSAVTRSS